MIISGAGHSEEPDYRVAGGQPEQHPDQRGGGDLHPARERGLATGHV